MSAETLHFFTGEDAHEVLWFLGVNAAVVPSDGDGSETRDFRFRSDPLGEGKKEENMRRKNEEDEQQDQSEEDKEAKVKFQGNFSKKSHKG